MTQCNICHATPRLVQTNRKWRVVCDCGIAVAPKSDNKTRAVYDWNVMNHLLGQRRTITLRKAA